MPLAGTDRCPQFGSATIEPSALVEKLKALATTGLVADPKIQNDAAARRRRDARLLIGSGTLFSVFIHWLLLACNSAIHTFSQPAEHEVWTAAYLLGWVGGVMSLGLFMLAFWRFFRPYLEKWLLRRARKLEALGAIALLEQDRRPPVVYLRPFSADHRWLSLTKTKSTEEVIASVVDDLGPFIAVGKPGESMPDLGANRFYVKEERWQEVVDMVIREAKLVILQAGGTSGLLWELNRLVSLKDPHKFLIYFDPRDRKLHPRFREAAKQVLPQPLPGFSAPSGFVYFNSDWTGKFNESIEAVLQQAGLTSQADGVSNEPAQHT